MPAGWSDFRCNDMCQLGQSCYVATLLSKECSPLDTSARLGRRSKHCISSMRHAYASVILDDCVLASRSLLAVYVGFGNKGLGCETVGRLKDGSSRGLVHVSNRGSIVLRHFGTRKKRRDSGIFTAIHSTNLVECGGSFTGVFGTAASERVCHT